MNSEEIDALFDTIDEYSDARTEVKAVGARVGNDASMAAYFAPQASNRLVQARAKVVRELAKFVRAAVRGELD